MRELRLIAWFFFGLTLGAFVAASAMAETVPSIPGTSVGFIVYVPPANPAQCAANGASTPEDACGKFGGNLMFNGNCSIDGVVYPQGSCQMTTPESCPDASYALDVVSHTCSRPDPCPAGQTHGASGTGECKPQCSASGSTGGQTGGMYNTATTNPGPICAIDGCIYNPTDCMGINGKNACWLGKSTGQSCKSGTRNADGSDYLTADQLAAQKTADAENACYGNSKCPITINGAVTCVACSNFSSSHSSSTTNPDGSTTNTNTTTTGTVSGGNTSTSTTTTTTTTPSGGGQGTSTTTNGSTDGSTAQYCDQNPNAPICSDKKTECEQNPNLAQCVPLGDPPASEQLPSQSMGVSSLSPVVLPGVAQCPADVPLPRGASFSWAGLCMYADGLRPVVLAIAWLGAALIVLGVKTE